LGTRRADGLLSILLAVGLLIGAYVAFGAPSSGGIGASLTNITGEGVQVDINDDGVNDKSLNTAIDDGDLGIGDPNQLVKTLTSSADQIVVMVGAGPTVKAVPVTIDGSGNISAAGTIAGGDQDGTVKGNRIALSENNDGGADRTCAASGVVNTLRWIDKDASPAVQEWVLCDGLTEFQRTETFPFSAINLCGPYFGVDDADNRCDFPGDSDNALKPEFISGVGSVLLDFGNAEDDVADLPPIVTPPNLDEGAANPGRVIIDWSTVSLTGSVCWCVLWASDAIGDVVTLDPISGPKCIDVASQGILERTQSVIPFTAGELVPGELLLSTVFRDGDGSEAACTDSSTSFGRIHSIKWEFDTLL